MDRKSMSVKEFRKLGLIQEINRRFLHPLGLALSVNIDDDGNESFGDIWDSRDDPEGFIYDLENSSKERIDNFKEKAHKIYKLELNKHETRKKLLGYIIESIPV